MKISIKPLSINKAFQGRRFKTQDYRSYEQWLMLLLPNIKLPKDIKISMTIERHFSNEAQDIDSSVKLTLDVLQKKWWFNDKQIYQLNMTKKIVPKWMEWFTLDVWEIVE